MMNRRRSLMPNIAQTDAFDRPMDYWLRRADRCRQTGDLRRASVLLRHAARLAPASHEAGLQYAEGLRELNCYEASSREAFSALASGPEHFALYGLIGRNMLSLGYRQEAMDAFALYMAGSRLHPDELPPWDDEVYDLEEMFYEPPRRRRARLDSLLDIAGSRISCGDFENARRALRRAARPPFPRKQARRDSLAAMYHECLNHQDAALFFARRSLRAAPRHPCIAASAACLFHRLDRPREAGLALLRAAACSRFASEELLVCVAAEQLRLLPIARRMLQRTLRRTPNRLPACYNLCVCHLKAGELETASGYIHLCRELDPDDLLVESLFSRVVGWQEEGADSAAVAEAARELPFYGVVLGGDLKSTLLPLAQALSEGLASFAARLQKDPKLYRRFLAALTLPVSAVERLLPRVCEALPREFCERLLREILTVDPRDGDAKRFAVSRLAALGASPPYLVWYEGRLASIDPAMLPIRTPTLLNRLLTLRIRQAERLNEKGGGLIPYALLLVSRMNRRQRLDLAGDLAGVWPLALALHFRAAHGLSPLPADRFPLGPTRAGALRQALRTLNALTVRKENAHGMH